MEIIFIKLICGLILFMLLLVLYENDILRKTYEEIYTNPILNKGLYLLGDILYIIGGSTMASVVWVLISTTFGFYYGHFAVGLIFYTLGRYLRKD